MRTQRRDVKVFITIGAREIGSHLFFHIKIIDSQPIWNTPDDQNSKKSDFDWTQIIFFSKIKNMNCHNIINTNLSESLDGDAEACIGV